MSSSTISPTPASRAFSLVEVALALGIISVALVALLGMVPIGLNTFRESLEDTVQADILRKLSAQFQEAPFKSLSNLAAMQYYNEEGVPTNEAAGLLGVKYDVSANTALLEASSYNNSHLKTVQVYFFTRADRAKNPPAASITNVIYVPPGNN